MYILGAIILVVAFFGTARWKFSRNFRKDVEELLSANNDREFLNEQDLLALPDPVKKYIRYCGYVGKEKVSGFKAEFEGQIRSSEKAGWMKFNAVQYSGIVDPCRYFFIKATMNALPVAGYHRFREGKATMDIRAASLVRVQYASGKEMDIAETVTHFNDMCLLAPGSLINSNISWDKINENEVRANYTNKGITISAILQFNDSGELVNFISDNRYMIGTDQQPRNARWMTPVRKYKEQDGLRFPGLGEAIWVLPEGNFIYARMNISWVSINPRL